MLRASGVSARVSTGAVPLLPGVRPLVEQGHVPGGTRRNIADLAASVSWDPSVDDTARTLLCDAQTSGGLLIGVTQTLTAGYQPQYAAFLGTNFHVVMPYVLMIAILLVRPYGLFGTKEVRRL